MNSMSTLDFQSFSRSGSGLRRTRGGLVRALTRSGQEISRQRGGHVRLRHPLDSRKRPVTVPLHNEVVFGTRKRILRDAPLTVEQLF